MSQTVAEMILMSGEMERRAISVVLQLHQLVFGATDQNARATLEGNHRLDEVSLAKARPIEAALFAEFAWVVLLAHPNQAGDRNQTEPGDELTDPLEKEEVADDRQHEVRIPHLQVGGGHSRTEDQEAEENSPVHDADPVPLQHARVSESLDQHVLESGAGLVLAAVGFRAGADDREHGANSGRQHGRSNRRENERCDAGYEVECAEVRHEFLRRTVYKTLCLQTLVREQCASALRHTKHVSW